MKKLLSTLERLRPPTPASSRPSSPTEGQSPASLEKEKTDDELTPQSPFSQQQSSQRPLPFREHSSSSIVTVGSYHGCHKRPSPRSSLAVRKSMSGVQLLPTPTQIEVLRYRYHHGVSLDGIFVMRRELCEDIFSVGGAGSKHEYDVVWAYLKKNGLPATRVRCDKHWKDSMTVQGWEWLSDAGVTSVRLNVGWHSFGTAWCEGTPFEPVKEVYINSYAHLKSFISAARKHDIGVLLNVQAPSLPNTTTVVNPWEDSKYRALFRKLIQYITQQSVSSLVLNQAIIGLQFVIDSQLPLTGLLAGEFYSWYDEIVDLIHSINPQLPIYVPASNSRDATLVSDSLHGRPLSGEFVSHHTMRGSSTEIENQRNPVFTITSTERPISGAANASLRGQEVVQNNDTVEDGDVKFTGCAIGVLSAPVQSLFEQDPFFQHASLRRGSLGHNEINASVMKHAESNAGVHSLGGYFWDLKAVHLKQLNYARESSMDPTLLGIPQASTNLNLPIDFITTLRTMALSKKTLLKSSALAAYKKSLHRTSSSSYFELEQQIEDDIPQDANALLNIYAEGWDLGFTDALAFWGGDCVAGNCGGGDTIGQVEAWLGKRVWWEYGSIVLGIQNRYGKTTGGVRNGEEVLSEKEMSKEAEIEIEKEKERKKGLKVLAVFEKAMGDAILEFEMTVGVTGGSGAGASKGGKLALAGRRGSR